MSEVRLFNTMSRQIEPLKTLRNHEVSLYTCGPTVYDYPQIGNWRTFVTYDTLVRTLRANDYETKHVLNITDVGHLTGDNEGDADVGEDRMEKAKKRERKTAWDIAKFYTEDFLKGLDALNIIKPNHLPRATDYILQQIDFVKKLETKGFTYQIDDGVYFDTSKLPDYGKLARLDTEKLKAGARVEFNQQKRNITDFALWKLTPSGEKRDMEWDSPWGMGFPGWHLECSVMAETLLGPTIDIHAGGIDHIPIHHTNEIAQSEAANGVEFAHYWLHGAFLTVNEQRIGKSVGNAITLQDITEKGFEPMALRLLYLQSHYQTSANFSWDILEAASNRLKSLRHWAELRWQAISKASEDETELIIRAGSDIALAMADNLNTPKVLEVLSATMNILLPTGISPNSVNEFNKLLKQVDDMLGLELLKSTPNIDSTARKLIDQRDAARAKNDFTSSDKIRDELLTQGLELDDTPSGSQWHRL